MSRNRVVQFLANWPGESSPEPSQSIVEIPGDHGITVALTRISGESAPNGPLPASPVFLRINGGSAVYEDCGELVINSPTALHELIAALVRVTANPDAARLLASIVPESDEDEEEADADEEDDDEDDGEPYR